MKQKKRAGGSDGMDLVLIGVKKGTFDKTKDSKEQEKKRRKTGGAKRKLSIENIVGMMFEYFRQYPNVLLDLRRLQCQ